MQLHLEALSHQFSDRTVIHPVLEGIELTLEAGEFVSVLGPSGCGKSTLLNILTGLLAPTSGRICLNDNVVAHLRHQVAYMQQKDLLLPWRQALPNAMLGAQLQKVHRPRAQAEARVLFEQFGLAGFERHYPGQLSGGMRQRVALVRTLLTHRPLWLLDEPFGALDSLNRMRLQRWMLKAWREHEKSVLMVTHDLEEALVLSDRIYVLTPCPARVHCVFAVPLPRPRDRWGLAFARAKQTLWERIEEVLDEV